MAQRSRVPRQLLDLQRQVMEFQKAAFDNTFNALSAMQDQQQELARRLVEESPRVPSEFKEMLEEWQGALRAGREQFRDSVERSFETIETYLDRLASEGEKADSGEPRTPAPSASGPKKKSGGAGAKKKSAPGGPKAGS